VGWPFRSGTARGPLAVAGPAGALASAYAAARTTTGRPRPWASVPVAAKPRGFAAPRVGSTGLAVGVDHGQGGPGRLVEGWAAGGRSYHPVTGDAQGDARRSGRPPARAGPRG